ncbi:protein 5NUC [Includes: UDP-sugar hydrolase [Nephila pilipes]|uniref:5'-nucleotidase n=1 Tax=Nephila pilipes TaxID=299642 RepID=A0A8X6UEV3_NEPPI|nr:protein 5NUC [Includes: UDP-sugar hydrolase [Nephila pilipes]
MKYPKWSVVKHLGTPPSIEEPQGPYPQVIERADGSRALVVQDFAFAKYLGFLEVQFDNEGKISSWQGNPILLDSSVPEDTEILELLEPYGTEVKRRVRQTVGHTNVLLRGDRLTCRMKECNLGNFLADASLDYFIEQPTEKGWNFVAVALWNSGGIRSSIDERMNEGNVTFEDVISVAPFGNTMDVVALKGKYLRQVLETSMRDYDLDSIDPPGSFLQVSGMRLTYNVSEPVGSRLIEAYVRCADCRVPQYQPLEDEKEYWVVMSTYMTKGGDGFAIIQENALANRNTDELDIDIIIKYAQKRSPITTGLENRITVLSARDNKVSSEAENATPTDSNSPAVTESADTDEIMATSSVTDVEKENSKPPPSMLNNILSEIDSGLDTVKTNLQEAGEKANKLLGINFPVG